MMRNFCVGEVWLDHAGNRCTMRDNGTIEVTTLNEEPSMTIQSEKDSCDINKILSKFNKTGVMSNVSTAMPQQGDFTDVVDYQSALNQVIAAQESFMTLPAQLRKRFANDPGQLLSFLEDPENRSEAISLGLVNPSPDVNDNVSPPSNDGG